MELSLILKSVIDSDEAPIVICNLEHEVVYINPSAAQRYERQGGYALVGKSLLNCHNAESNKKINQVVEWFELNPKNNKVFTYYNEKENKDVYMIALRDDSGTLIGYYEKHEYRNRENGKLYEIS